MARFPVSELLKNIGTGLKSFRVKLYGTDGTNEVEVKTGATGELKVDVVSGSVVIDPTDGGNIVQARNATASNLKVDANLQVGGSDNTLANPAFMQLTGSITQDVTFHDAATEAADGTVLTVGGLTTLTVEISGTSTSRTIAFIGRGPSGTDRAIMGIRLSDLSTAISTTGTGELWQFDITGLTSVFMDLQDVAGGNVSVKGKAVA